VAVTRRCGDRVRENTKSLLTERRTAVAADQRIAYEGLAPFSAEKRP
jgi:hypothetical protein